MPFSEAAEAPHVRRVCAYVEAPGFTEFSDVQPPYKRAWAAAVVANLASSSLTLLPELGEKLGERLACDAVKALSCSPQICQSYGKGAILGGHLDNRHASAILHPQMGRPIRKLLQRGKAVIPSTVKRGPPGTRLDIPLHGIDDEWNIQLFDSIEIFVPGAPNYDEIVVVVALTAGSRSGELPNSVRS